MCFFISNAVLNAHLAQDSNAVIRTSMALLAEGEAFIKIISYQAVFACCIRTETLVIVQNIHVDRFEKNSDATNIRGLREGGFLPKARLNPGLEHLLSTSLMVTRVFVSVFFTVVISCRRGPKFDLAALKSDSTEEVIKCVGCSDYFLLYST
uniref:Endonuclease/exonuclease/phosphatase domain-containing protein n=1 Tax=Strongyloides stercoralis TaxID=6248 RepID=A0A0K0E668_STRER